MLALVVIVTMLALCVVFICAVRLADDFERHSQQALLNPEHHLSNPVNAFQLVKRFTTDWEFIVHNYIRNNASEGLLIFILLAVEY